MHTSNNVQGIVHDERVYAAVFPLVRGSQGAWLAPAVMVGLFLIPAVYTMPLPGDLRAMGIVASMLLAIPFIVPGFWTTISICRMHPRVGYSMLFFGILGSCFFVGCTIYLIVAPREVLGEDHVSRIRFAVAWMVFMMLMGYSNLSGVKAGRWVAFAPPDTRRVVAQIDPEARRSWRWLSTALGVPVPLRYVRIRGVLPVSLFLFSSVCLSLFGVLSSWAILFSSFPLMVWAGIDYTEPGLDSDAWSMAIDRFMLLYAALVLAGLAVAALVVGLKSRAAARRTFIRSIQESQEHDGRPPILFLRSFHDDQVGLPATRLPLSGRLLNLFQARASLDVVLLEEGTEYGPVVAVGRPGEPVPPYGAARGYFADGEWRGSVARLARESRYIVLALDHTEGLLWELEHIVSSGHLPKTLLLVPPAFREPDANRDLLRAVNARIESASSAALDLRALVNGDTPVIGFHVDSHGVAAVRASTTFSEAAYLLAIRWFLRMAVHGQARVRAPEALANAHAVARPLVAAHPETAL